MALLANVTTTTVLSRCVSFPSSGRAMSIQVALWTIIQFPGVQHRSTNMESSKHGITVQKHAKVSKIFEKKSLKTHD